jgi:hypothetical protein
VILRRTIVARQLSGDPSKINPALSLNQQANALAYNPKHEIERYSVFHGFLQAYIGKYLLLWFDFRLIHSLFCLAAPLMDNLRVWWRHTNKKTGQIIIEMQ